jgi:hypothetical protein
MGIERTAEGRTRFELDKFGFLLICIIAKHSDEEKWWQLSSWMDDEGKRKWVSFKKYDGKKGVKAVLGPFMIFYGWP